MGLTIALKHDGVVYMGSDSLVSKYGVKHYMVSENNYRIFRVKGCKEALMSLDGSLVEHNVARCQSPIPAGEPVRVELNFEYMVNKFVPQLLDLFYDRHILDISDDNYCCQSDMLVAYKDKIFEIYPDGGVLESSDYAAIGQGAVEALGSLFTTRNIDDPKERIKMALMAGMRTSNKISYPLIITDTKTFEFEIIEDMR